ncbi:MAG: NAD-binding protein [Treponema sp.]|jgi:trk system potassium uptake protein TrkA|nr:NAD-binding protein [Treponema sp.]
MRIIIAGAGRTGTQLARCLIQEKHDVSMIESNEERARHASNRLDCLVLHDEGNSMGALEEAGIAKADALVCVTDSDEINMITCGLAASRNPGLLKIARVKNDEYVRLSRNAGQAHATDGDEPAHNMKVLGIDSFINPDVEAARAIYQAVSHGALGNILDFEGTPYKLGSVTIEEGSPFDGLCMKDYRSHVKEESLVTLVERETGSENKSFLPSGDDILKSGDRIHIFTRETNMEHIFRLAGRYEKPLRHIGIVGGGRIGSLTAEAILGTAPGNKVIKKIEKKAGVASLLRLLKTNSRRRVVIVEQDYNVCKDLSARFPEALVLNQDISDESFIAEERLNELDLIVAATANQELNIITALFLKSKGVKRAIALVSGSSYETIARRLGVDVVIPMQTVVVDSILSNLGRKNIREVHRMGDGTLEILEAEIGDNSPIAGKPISEFKFSKDALIMLVNRGEETFIPQGDYVFNHQDKVIIIAANGSEAEMERFFG